MSSEAALKSGDLKQTLTLLQDEVRKAPGNVEKRIFLVQLLCVLGQWDRAMTQLSVLGEMASKTLPMAQTYQEAIRCEVLRAEVLAGKKAPLVFGQPAEWIALMIEAVRIMDKDVAAAESLRARALDLAPGLGGTIATTVSGTLEKSKFAWIADADSRIGPQLEAIVNGRYFWIPFDKIQRLKVEKPTDLRDFVWAPAQLMFVNGGETPALIPARYTGTEQAAASDLLLSRRTEWSQKGPETFVGTGLRMFATDQGELSLFELDIQFDSPPGTEEIPGA